MTDRRHPNVQLPFRDILVWSLVPAVLSQPRFITESHFPKGDWKLKPVSRPVIMTKIENKHTLTTIPEALARLDREPRVAYATVLGAVILLP